MRCLRSFLFPMCLRIDFAYQHPAYNLGASLSPHLTLFLLLFFPRFLFSLCFLIYPVLPLCLQAFFHILLYISLYVSSLALSIFSLAFFIFVLFCSVVCSKLSIAIFSIFCASLYSFCLPLLPSKPPISKTNPCLCNCSS